jgi:hypothetical protein
MYYVRRGNKVTGPFAQTLLEQAYANSQLMKTDYVGSSPSGPWMPAERAMEAFRSRGGQSNQNVPAAALRSPPTVSSTAPVKPSRGPAYLVEVAAKREAAEYLQTLDIRINRRKKIVNTILTALGLFISISIVALAFRFILIGPSPTTTAITFFYDLGNNRFAQAKRNATGDALSEIEKMQFAIREMVRALGGEQGKNRNVDKLDGWFTANVVTSDGHNATVAVVLHQGRDQFSTEVTMVKQENRWKVKEMEFRALDIFYSAYGIQRDQ